MTSLHPSPTHPPTRPAAFSWRSALRCSCLLRTCALHVNQHPCWGASRGNSSPRTAKPSARALLGACRGNSAPRNSILRALLGACRGNNEEISAALTEVGVVTEKQDIAIRARFAYGMFDTRYEVREDGWGWRLERGGACRLLVGGWTHVAEGCHAQGVQKGTLACAHMPADVYVPAGTCAWPMLCAVAGPAGAAAGEPLFPQFPHQAVRHPVFPP
jgi:hypothetical protein